MNTMKYLGIALGITAAAAGCSGGAGTTTADTESPFETTVGGKQTGLYTITNQDGTLQADITNFGGRIVALRTPGADGNMVDVALGFDSIADYVNIPSDFGASVGRYANRINKGRMVVNGDTVQLPVNNFGHCLHGGPTGWQYQVYEVKEVTDSSVTMVMNSPDGDNNFPGNVVASVTFTITPDNALDIAYSATTDAPTVINMTNHTYFNLGGDPSKSIEDHILTVNASQYTPVDSTYMTTGEIAPVAGTPFDFTRPKAVGADINADNEQIHNGNGYDHNWVLDTKGDISTPAATLTSPVTGITMDVYTTEPGIQVYTGNFLDGTVKGKRGVAYPGRAGICLETQHYPDSPNKADWPSVTLLPGQEYTSHTIYKFSTK